MRTARSRLGKDFSLEARLSKCELALERNHYDLAGRWNEWIPESCRAEGKRKSNPYREVRLDLGCGKGFYTVECARRNPHVLFVGVDLESVCIMRGAELAVSQGVPNAVFVLDQDPDLERMFAPHELSMIYLMFPTPFPQKKKAHLRTTHANRLLCYRDLLNSEGLIRLQTDSNPMFEYSKTQLDLARFNVLWESCDLRRDQPGEPAGEYEVKTVSKGARVYALEAKPNDEDTPAVEDIVQTASQSLIDYLPDDLDSLDYVPHGMEGSVTNMRNRKANALAREGRKSEKLHGKKSKEIHLE